MLNRNQKSKIETPIRHEGGFALAMTLIMLLVLTILGVTAMNMSSLQQKMAGNMQESQVAFQAAESAVREAEAWLLARPAPAPLLAPPTVCTTPTTVCTLGVGDTIESQNEAWWDTNSREFGAAGGTPDLVKAGSKDPRYVIEYIETHPYSLNQDPNVTYPRGRYYYRISAQGWGNAPSAKALLQTTYVRHYP